ncbi:insulin-like [Notolabrus celidotus]|uniref:insulin-like n=1 Tax=Notolabrus celidotus TaxID=1203425 RepID=UPI00148FC28D|nr:insulin-like [Notolabrus celidotus]
MTTLWLQSVSLLVLVVVSWPSTQAAPASKLLCGSHLVDALYLVCGDRGFGFHLRRDVDAAEGGAKKVSPVEMSGLVEQCCYQPCNLFELQNYCSPLLG